MSKLYIDANAPQFRCFVCRTTTQTADEQLNLLLRQSLSRRCHSCGRKFYHGTGTLCGKCLKEGGDNE